MKPTTCHWCGDDYNDCNKCTHRGVYIEPERLARLERCAKDWAREQVGFVAHTTNEALKNNMSFGAGYTVCKCCSKSVWSDTGQVAIIHAHDCDAAHILGLEREGER